MNLKKMIFGILILGLSPNFGLASAEAIHGNFKVLPGECKGLENAEYVQNFDFALAERERLAKEAAGLINSASQAAPKQQACQRYLRAVQNVEQNLKGKIRSARFSAGNANLIGGVAVVKGVQTLAPNCYGAMKKKETELSRKEANFRQLCK